ncbi:hypothetical protein ACQ4WX_44725 [Streptomyces lasalocidi]
MSVPANSPGRSPSRPYRQSSARTAQVRGSQLNRPTPACAGRREGGRTPSGSASHTIAPAVPRGERQQFGAEPLGEPGEQILVQLPGRSVGLRRAQHGEHAERLAVTRHRDVHRPEREGQPRRELRIPAHRLGGVRQHHPDPEAIGVGHGEGTADVQPPPGAEQRAGQAAEHREPQQAGRPGAQVHRRHPAARHAQRAGRGVGQQRGQPGLRTEPPFAAAPSHRSYLVPCALRVADTARMRHEEYGTHLRCAPLTWPIHGEARVARSADGSS